MIVVADASPIRYAFVIGIGAAVVELYGRILIPGRVMAELTQSASPPGIGAWIQGDERIEVRQVAQVNDPSLAHIDPGEREAILLAESIPGAILLIDDLDGRREALRRCLTVTGLLGAIRDCALRGLVDFEETLRRLKATDFRISDSLEAEIRRQFNTRRP